MGLTLEDVAAELLAGPLADFVQRRAARAKELKAADAELAAQVTKLPKPVASAHLLNAFARERSEELEQLLGLGAELREAQEQRDGDEVRRLTGEAHEAIRAALRSLQDLADEQGTRVTDEAAVEQTLRAAMADAGAAAALQTGLLVKPLSPAGFGEVDLVGSVAAVPALVEQKPRSRPKTSTRGEEGTAHATRDRAVEAARAAVEALERAETRRHEAHARWEAAVKRHQAAREAVEQAEEELRQAKAAEREQTQQEQAARKELDTAERPVQALAAKAEQARQALEGQ